MKKNLLVYSMYGIGSVLLIFFVTTILPWLLIFVMSIFEPNPPEPEIKYGEFPFRLEYKINDEIFVVEDIAICEYAGVKWNEGSGKYRTWIKKIKTSGDENVLILTDDNIKIYCNIGKAEYYMDDLVYSISDTPTPNFYYVGDYVAGGTEELLDKHKIELIDFSLSKPINNTFK